ncbi:hypothetical protein R5R35_006818 [Gryllus longicercus]
METYMLKNNPVSVKEDMSKARANIEGLRYRRKDALEEKAEFQKAIQSLVKREEITSIKASREEITSRKKTVPTTGSKEKERHPAHQKKTLEEGRQKNRKLWQSQQMSPVTPQNSRKWGWREMKDG